MLTTLLLAFLAAAPPTHRAMWVWDAAAGEEAVSFARSHGITDIFLQWPGASGREKFRAFVRAASRGGVAVHALDGWPEAALPEHHGEVLALVEAVAGYNAAVPAGERVKGIHLDIEPYLLAGFDGPLRGEILAGFVELQKKVAARASRAGLAYGADLPFWFDDAAVNETLGVADNVGVMDYRNRALGDDGIVAHGKKWIEAGDRLRRKVWIAVETAPAEASTAQFGASFSEEQWQGLTSRSFPPLRMSRFAGFRIAVEERKGRRLIGLAAPGAMTGEFAAALEKLRETALRAGATAEDTKTTTPGLRKTTFDGIAVSEMERELGAVEQAFGSARSFSGIAIHHYGSYRDMK